MSAAGLLRAPTCADRFLHGLRRSKYRGHSCGHYAMSGAGVGEWTTPETRSTHASQGTRLLNARDVLTEVRLVIIVPNLLGCAVTMAVDGAKHLSF